MSLNGIPPLRIAISYMGLTLCQGHNFPGFGKNTFPRDFLSLSETRAERKTEESVLLKSCKIVPLAESQIHLRQSFCYRNHFPQVYIEFYPTPTNNALLHFNFTSPTPFLNHGKSTHSFILGPPSTLHCGTFLTKTIDFSMPVRRIFLGPVKLN